MSGNNNGWTTVGKGPLPVVATPSAKTVAKPAATASSDPVAFYMSKAPADVVAFDCEMIDTRYKRVRNDKRVAQIAIVDSKGTLYNKYVQLLDGEVVVDLRTERSGITMDKLTKYESVSVATMLHDVANHFGTKKIIGHAISNDIEALNGMGYGFRSGTEIADTQNSPHFRRPDGKPISLKLLARCIGVRYQEGAHDALDDAKMTLALFGYYHSTPEATIKAKVAEILAEDAKEKAPEKAKRAAEVAARKEAAIAAIAARASSAGATKTAEVTNATTKNKPTIKPTNKPKNNATRGGAGGPQPGGPPRRRTKRAARRTM
jgi:hypothetical protein